MMKSRNYHVPSSAKTLRISYVGMISQDVSIKPGVIKVVLKSDAKGTG